MKKEFIFIFLILGFVVSMSSCWHARKKPTSPLYSNKLAVHDDYWPFDCDELPDYLDRYGVTDENGNGHPGYVGWTLREFQNSPFEYSRGFSSQGKFYCPCNHVEYQTLEECLRNCKVTLGCFTGICEPIGQTCVVSNDVDVTFYANISVSVAKWNPSGGLSAACLVEKFRWEKDNLKHEQHHVKDIERLVEEANRRWQGAQSFEACGSSETDADNNLRNSILQALSDEIRFLEQEIERLSSEFHSSPEGGPVRSINCVLCD
jgi:hypothetical protein